MFSSFQQNEIPKWRKRPHNVEEELNKTRYFSGRAAISGEAGQQVAVYICIMSLTSQTIVGTLPAATHELTIRSIQNKAIRSFSSL